MKRTSEPVANGWQAVAEHYGLYDQTIKAIEEISELGYVRSMPHGLTEIIGECADASAMCEQLLYLHHADRPSARPDGSTMDATCFRASTILARDLLCTEPNGLRDAVIDVLALLNRQIEDFCADLGKLSEFAAEKKRKLERQQRRIRQEGQT